MIKLNIQEETTKFFKQDKEYVLKYLEERKINNSLLNELFLTNPFALLRDVVFKDGSNVYGISHLLSCSDIDGYDIKKSNLKIKSDEYLAFAITIGDDLVLYNMIDNKIYLYTFEDERLFLISKSLKEFINHIECERG